MNIQQEAYEKWLSQFDLRCEALSLKVRHIKNVVGFARDIATIRNMSKEDIQLAEFIAQHHDDGRFEQWTVYETFNDKQVCNDGLAHPHASLSIKILFDENKISAFASKVSSEEAIIVQKAIARHGDLVLKTDDLTERELIHCRIIRDADMLDNLVNIKAHETVKSLMEIQGFTLDELAHSTVTKEVFDTFCSHSAINYGIVKTPADWWLTWVAYIYNLSLTESLKVVNDNISICRIFDRLNAFKNTDTVEIFRQARKIAEDYVTKDLYIGELKGLLDNQNYAVVTMKAKMFLSPSCDPYSRKRFYADVYYQKRENRYIKVYWQDGKYVIDILDEEVIDRDSRLVDNQMPVVDDCAILQDWERVLLLESGKPYYSTTSISDNEVIPDNVLIAIDEFLKNH